MKTVYSAPDIKVISFENVGVMCSSTFKNSKSTEDFTDDEDYDWGE